MGSTSKRTLRRLAHRSAVSSESGSAITATQEPEPKRKKSVKAKPRPETSSQKSSVAKKPSKKNPLKSILKKQKLPDDTPETVKRAKSIRRESTKSENANTTIGRKGTAPIEDVPYKKRQTKPKIESTKFSSFLFRGPMPENISLAKYSIPRESFDRALEFLENPTKVKKKKEQVSTKKEKMVPAETKKVPTKIELDKVSCTVCDKQSRNAIGHQPMEKYAPTELTAIAMAMHQSLDREDWTTLSHLLSLSTQHGMHHATTMFMYAFNTLVYDQTLRDYGMLDSFLQGCLGCKTDSDCQKFMTSWTQMIDAPMMSRTNSDKKRAREDRQTKVRLSGSPLKSRVGLDFGDNQASADEDGIIAAKV